MRKETISSILEGSHKNMNEVVVSTAGKMEGSYIVWKIDERLKERGITQKDLANMTGLRIGTISHWVNGKQVNGINYVQLFAIMTALRITDVSDIFEIRTPSELQDKFESQRSEWISSKEMPIELKEMYKENVIKANNL